MVWLYLPPEAITHAQTGKACSASRSAQARAGLTSDSISPSQNIALWVTLSGKAMPQPRSWRGWKTRPWIARLSGTMLPALTANRGAAWWISSMVAIRASRSRSRDASLATKTRATSGRTSHGLCEKPGHPFASSKTSPDIYDWASSKLQITFDAWVIALRQACLRRRKSARPIGASDCSSWLTPRAQESGEKQDTFLKRNGDRTERCSCSLKSQAAMWPTATATDGNKSGPNSKHGSGSLHLPAAAVQTQWYTPNVPNGGRRNPPDMSPTGRMPSGKKRQVGLENQAIHIWPTPLANPNTNRQTKPTPSQLKGEHGLNLAMVAVTHTWPTPRACSGKRSSGANRTELVEVWATPTTRDWKDGTAMADVETNSLLGRQAPRSMKNGNASPLTLNPLFVEWLMGWPISWTVASTGCGCAATALSRWSRLMRCELSRLLQSQVNEQPDLFA